MTKIDEIAPDLFRLSIYVPDFDMQFNHFLVRDEEVAWLVPKELRILERRDRGLELLREPRSHCLQFRADERARGIGDADAERAANARIDRGCPTVHFRAPAAQPAQFLQQRVHLRRGEKVADPQKRRKNQRFAPFQQIVQWSPRYLWPREQVFQPPRFAFAMARF